MVHLQVPGLIAAPSELRLIQVLHDAEFNGSIDWMQDAGFWVCLDEETLSATDWPEAEAVLRARAATTLRYWVENPDPPD